MTDSNDILKRIQALESLLYKLSVKDPESLQELNSLHLAIFKTNIDLTCPFCIQKAYKQLKSITHQTITKMSERKYELKKGVLLTYPAYSGGKYTNANLTDKIAEAFLKEHPDRVNLFAKMPVEPVVESKYKGKKFDELKAIYKAVLGNEAPKELKSKDDLIKAIEKAELDKATAQPTDNVVSEQ